ncbi:hypothetical protein [Arthrobacter humicola]|jgi:hypothetical protein|uniref:hypothetical protein n=1 Tax=Arthrobacter humicola TaxID=409291 RepID=UPI001FABFCC5|nr:hypothetical protein [Arthrobacter humicola]MCI9870300.1 hypothetical protein [Arthrobacter humicola]
MESIYELSESIPVQTTAPESIAVLMAGLRAAGYIPRNEGESVSVREGSNFSLRIWGTMLPWGRKSIPIGMTVTLKETTTGTEAVVHAYDRLGWYLDAKTNPVLKEESQRKMAVLVELARKILST